MKVFITGGSSGIGLALAKKYLEKDAEVGVCSRNVDKKAIDETNEKLKVYRLDVCDKNALRRAVDEFSMGMLDLMIVAAGTYTETVITKPTYKESAAMLTVNIVGALNAIELAREIMGEQRSGHIVVIASVAGLLDYPQAGIYAKTRRALIQIADAYRRALSDFGIVITTIAPGYVDTPRLRELNEGDLSKKPFCVDSDSAVETIMKAIESKKEMLIFPRKMKISIRLLSMFPNCFLNWFMLKKAVWSQKK